MTFGDLLYSTWSVFVNRLSLLWAAFFAVLIPAVLMVTVFFALNGFGLIAVARVLAATPPGTYPVLPQLNLSLPSIMAGIIVMLLVYLLVLPYSISGFSGTVAAAVRSEEPPLVVDFFINGFRYYRRTWGFLAFSMLLGGGWGLVSLLGDIMLRTIPALGLLWQLAMALAWSCLLFFWIPAVYLEDQSQVAALASALHSVFALGGWARAMSVLLSGLAVAIVIGAVSALLDITIIGLLVGIPLALAGAIFIQLYFFMTSFVNHLDKRDRLDGPQDISWGNP